MPNSAGKVEEMVAPVEASFRGEAYSRTSAPPAPSGILLTSYRAVSRSERTLLVMAPSLDTLSIYDYI